MNRSLMDLTIWEVEKACGGTLVLQGASGEQRVSGVVLDSRQVTENGIFVATVGERVDGHRFISEVFQKGAALVITEKSPKQVEQESGASEEQEGRRQEETWGSYLLVPDTFQALKDLAEYYRRKLSIPMVGITGSVGKTSTKEFIAGVLAEKYCVLKTEGNFNNEIGVPLTLLRIRPEHEAAVVEMGISDFGEMHRLSRMVRPNICVITNIGQCHLENLKTRDGILKAKTEIFDFMAEDGEVCLNGEDDKLQTVTMVHGKKTHFFGLGGFPQEEVYASDVTGRGLWGSDAVLHREGVENRQIHVPLPGAHMVINAAAAACVAGILGLTSEQIAEGISKISAIGGRNNLIRLSHYTLIDDCYNANPVSMKAAVELLAMADTEKIAVLGDMFELGEHSDLMHAEVGAYAAGKGIDRIYCVGTQARFLYEGAVQAKNNAAGSGRIWADGKPQLIQYFETKEALLQAFAADREKWIPEGCTVLIKASHGMAFTEILSCLKEQA